MSDREGITTSIEASSRPDAAWWHRHEDHVRGDRPVRLDLFVRTLGPPMGTHRRQGAILDRLESLDHRDAVESVRVRVWGDSICLSECCSTHPDVGAVRDRVEQYLTWGEETPGVSVPFDRRSVDSWVTEERFEVLDLPTVALAVSTDATLECLLPAQLDGDWWTVERYLDWFERARDRREESLAVNV